MSSSKELYQIGHAQLLRGESQAAIASFLQALKQSPNSALLHFDLAQAYHKLQKDKQAIHALKRALELKNDFVEALELLASLHRSTHHYPEAIVCYQRLIELCPKEARFFRLLANTFLQAERGQAAVPFYERSLELDPSHPVALRELAVALREEHAYERAIEVAKQAIDADPTNAEAYNNLGGMLNEAGQFEEAQKMFQKALEKRPTFGLAWSNFADSKRFKQDDRDVLPRIEALFNAHGATAEDRCCAHFALGKIYSDLKEWGQAFEHYRQGNEEIPSDFDMAAHVARVDALIKTFTPELFDALKPCGSESALPVFIVGMPRSGTSLLEQILASHSQAEGAGELTDMSALASQLHLVVGNIDSNSYPQCIYTLTAEQAKRQCTTYLKRLRRYAPKAQRISDKMPSNFLHLGLMAILFPKAQFIHCCRDPMAVALSCYCKNFSRLGLGYTKDLRTLAQYYIQYQRLMEHWKNVLPVPLLELHYEALIERPEDETRKILEACGLSWEETCMDFHKNRRVVQTASKWEVRQPLYTSAVARWKHFEQQLKPFAESIQGVSTG